MRKGGGDGPDRGAPRGITLIEMLLAILIFSVLVALSVSAVFPLIARSRLGRSVVELTNALRLARELAMTEGAIVHVRFVRPAEDGKMQWIGVYRFGREERDETDRVRGFVQEGLAGLADWPECLSCAPEAIPWEVSLCNEEFRAELDGTVRLCVHGRTSCPGDEADAYDAAEEETWLPRAEQSGGAGEYRALYFFPDGSASANFFFVLRTDGERASAVRLRRLDGRTEVIPAFTR